MKQQEPGRTGRIEARIAPDALAIVRRAAEIQGRSVSDFVVGLRKRPLGRQSPKWKSFSFHAKRRNNSYRSF